MIKILLVDRNIEEGGQGISVLSVAGPEIASMMYEALDTFQDTAGDWIKDSAAEVVKGKLARYLQSMGYSAIDDAYGSASIVFVMNLPSGDISPSMPVSGDIELTRSSIVPRNILPPSGESYSGEPKTEEIFPDKIGNLSELPPPELFEQEAVSIQQPMNIESIGGAR